VAHCLPGRCGRQAEAVAVILDLSRSDGMDHALPCCFVSCIFGAFRDYHLTGQYYDVSAVLSPIVAMARLAIIPLAEGGVGQSDGDGERRRGFRLLP